MRLRYLRTAITVLCFPFRATPQKVLCRAESRTAFSSQPSENIMNTLLLRGLALLVFAAASHSAGAQTIPNPGFEVDTFTVSNTNDPASADANRLGLPDAFLLSSRCTPANAATTI